MIVIWWRMGVPLLLEDLIFGVWKKYLEKQFSASHLIKIIINCIYR
jgi:hypothetical protein